MRIYLAVYNAYSLSGGSYILKYITTAPPIYERLNNKYA